MKKLDIADYRIVSGKGFKLADIKTNDTGKYKDKNDAAKDLEANIATMAQLQDRLYADNRYAMLVIIQAMDTAGKDGVIKHVMSGLNPQGTQVYSFKVPSVEELDHDYLWRVNKCLPERGRIGIFNRSYYEEVLVVKVHNLLAGENLPDVKNIWEERYRQMRNFEQYLCENGIIPVKFMLHISKDTQKERLLARIDDPTKNWKFSEGDVKERAFWEDYQRCYEEMIAETSTKYAPWHVIPADKKWFGRLAVSEVIVQRMKELKLEYPKLNKAQQEALARCKAQLQAEK
jgi:PPK2 family polyphosphate:nucleotide phosphotransferase